MTEHKFTDEEVIKALECCKDADCVNCPRWSEEWYSGQCADFLPSVLDLINRQKAEVAYWQDTAANAKREAIKEFAERLKKYYRTLNGGTSAGLVEYHIDQIQKEMLGKVETRIIGNDTCVCCGETIPEGVQVCPTCEKGEGK